MNAQTNFCGHISKPVTVSESLGNENTPFKIYDAFGNIYTVDEVRIYKNPNLLSLRNAFEEGIFILTFEDVERVNGKGFDHSVFGQQRRDIVRQVFRELSDFLQTPNNTPRVRINIKASEVLPATGDRVLGEASPFYFTPSSVHSTIIDNDIATTVNGGVDSHIGLHPIVKLGWGNGVLPHGFIKFYFPSTDDNEYYYDITNSNVPSSKFDFYTVVLHEVLHCMGFGSNFSQDGRANTGFHNRYDSFLHFSDNNTPPLLSPKPEPKISEVIYSDNGRTNALFKGCGANNGIVFKGLNLLTKDVFTPTTWSGGSSLSHIECDPICNSSTPQQNVMRACAVQGPNGVFRHPSQTEADALCDLGYKRNNVWGLNPSNTTIRKTYSGCTAQRCAYGVYDRFDSNGKPYEIIGNGSITINNVLNNDVGTNLSITQLKIWYGGGSLTNQTSNSFTFTSVNNFSGLVVLSDIPACASNNIIKGNLTYIFIYVKPGSCPIISNPICGQDLVCFGDFELTKYQDFYSSFFTETSYGNSIDLFRGIENGAHIIYEPDNTINRSYTMTCGTFPFPKPTGTDNRQYMGISGDRINKEAAKLPLRASLDPNKTYRLTFDATARSMWEQPNCNITSVLRILGSDREPCDFSERTSITPGIVLGCGFNPQLVKDVAIDVTNNWTSYTVEFSGRAINQLFFTVLSSTYIFIDNVKLELITCPTPCQPAGFTAVGTDVNSVTTVSSLINSGVLPTSYWQRGEPREQLYVNGTLVVDQGYGFYDSRLKMAPGSRILVNEGSFLDIDAGTVIDGCDQMWKGIQFQSGSFLWVWNSTIQDAEFAVAVERNNNPAGTYLSIINSTFLDNFHSIYIPDKAGTSSEIQAGSYVQNCVFANPRGNLKPAYPGQVNYDIKTRSGIHALDVPALSVTDCSFKQMDFGIWANTANLTVTNTSFADMPFRELGWFDRRGYGIFFNNGTLNYTGFGKNGASTINNAYCGVKVISSKFNIQDCNITNCNYGVDASYSQLNTNFSPNFIKNNTITANTTGVILAFNGNSKIWVEGNDIKPAANELNRGIGAIEWLQSIGDYQIVNNNINITSTGIASDEGFGIALLGIGQNTTNHVGAVLSGNTIFIDNRASLNANGVKVAYSSNYFINYNYIDGTAQNSSTGIDVANSSGLNEFVCNEMDNLRVGMTFSGNNLMDQGLQSNHFYQIKEIGLFLSADAIIGQQFNTSNIWEFDGYSDRAAKYLGTNTAASRITANTALKFFARNNISPSSDWFAPTSATPFDFCNSSFSTPTTPTLVVRGEKRTEEEVINHVNSSYRTVAEGKNKNQSEAIQNLANRQLLRFLDIKSKDNRLKLNGAFNVYKTKMQSKFEKKQYDWDRDVEAALTMDTVVVNKLKENGIQEQIALKKAISDGKTMMEMEKKDKVAAMKTFVTDNTLARLVKERNDIEAEHKKKMEKAKSKLRTNNKNNKGQKLYEQHESAVNDVFLDLAEGKKLSKAQIDQLDIIANLCPSVGGVAVYKARTILGSLELLIGKRSWSDWKNCSENAIAIRSEDLEKPESSISTPKVLAFPNPTDGILRLSFYDTNEANNAPHTIQIFNTTGASIKVIELEGLQDTDIDTQSMPTGMYILKISARDKEWSKTIKVSILR